MAKKAKFDLYAELGVTGVQEYTGKLSDRYHEVLQGPAGIKKMARVLRREPAAFTAWNMAALAAAPARWSCVPGGESKADQEAAAFVEQCMADMSHTWQSSVRFALSAWAFGWADHEIVWKRRLGQMPPKDLPSSKWDDQLIGVRKLAPRRQETIQEWQTDDTGGHQAMIQLDPSTGRTLEPIPIEKLLHYIGGDERGSWEGLGWLEPAFWVAYLIEQLEQIGGATAQRGGTGLPVFKFLSKPESTTASAVDTIGEELTSSQLQYVKLPLAVDFDLKTVPLSNLSEIRGWIDQLRWEISALLAATFIRLGSTERGTQSLAGTIHDAFTLGVDSSLDIVQDVHNRHLIPRILAANPGKFKGITEHPRLTHSPITRLPPMVAQWLANITEFIGNAEPEDVEWVRAIFDMPYKSAADIAKAREEAKAEEEKQAAAEKAAAEKAAAKLPPPAAPAPPAAEKAEAGAETGAAETAKKPAVEAMEILLGGPGSGHRGHKGRKGQVGGSVAGNGSAPAPPVPPDVQARKDDPEYAVRIVEKAADVKSDQFGKGYFILGDEIDPAYAGKLVDINNEFGGGTNDHVGFIAGSMQPELFGMTAEDANTLYRGYTDFDSPEATDWMREGWEKIFASGAIRVRQFQHSVSLDTESMDTVTLHRLQKAYYDGRLDMPSGAQHFWAGNMEAEFVSFTREEFLQADRFRDLKDKRFAEKLPKHTDVSGYPPAVERALLEAAARLIAERDGAAGLEMEILAAATVEMGGPGSGHHGHKGRKGQIGGSAPGGGSAPAPPVPPSPADGFARFRGMSMQDRRAAWGQLTEAERDDLADAAHSVPAAMREIMEGMPPWSRSEDLEADISNRVRRAGDRITAASQYHIEDTAHRLAGQLAEAGVETEAARALLRDATDALIVQAHEAMARQLGDHGSRHIKADVELALEILRVVPGENSPLDRAKVTLGAIYHDTGYLTEPSRAFMDEGHPRWSEQHYAANVRDTVAAALGSKAAADIGRMIGTHQQSDLDWQRDPLGSALRAADNLSLFHTNKLPPVFAYVSGNTRVLEQLARKEIDLATAKTTMRANLAAEKLPRRITAQLGRAIDEVGEFTPKYTLGMLGGRVVGVSWRGHVHVELQRTPSSDLHQRILDLGQRQFGKFAESYGAEAGAFLKELGFTFRDSAGRPVLSAALTGHEPRLGEAFFGGKGSGHYGHRGIKGQRGGSQPGGGGSGATPLGLRSALAKRLMPDPQLVKFDSAGFLAAERRWQERWGDRCTIGALSYAYEMTVGNVRSQITRVDGSSESISVTGTLTDAQTGDYIGHFSRYFNPGPPSSVYHSSFGMDDEYRGSGFGAAFLARSEALYRRMGVEKVSVYADGTNGGYTWARMGYDWNPEYPSAARAITKQLKAAWRERYGADNPPPLPDKAGDAPYHPWELAVIKGPDGYGLGKEIMVAAAWHGVKNIGSGDEGERVGLAYYRHRKYHPQTPFKLPKPREETEEPSPFTAAWDRLDRSRATRADDARSAASGMRESPQTLGTDVSGTDSAGG